MNIYQDQEKTWVVLIKKPLINIKMMQAARTFYINKHRTYLNFLLFGPETLGVKIWNLFPQGQKIDALQDTICWCNN